MSVTSGFFNSLNHDRRYNAQQMSSIFDGVINDGVFANIGVAFKVSAAGGVTVNIGEGKAWLNNAWVYNDALLPLTFEGSEVVLDRIDAIVVDVDHNESVRSGNIKIVKGTPSSSPKRPTMVSDAKHKQIPLAYVTRKAGSTAITQANITSMIGTSECPYITGILQVQNIDNIVTQWNAQWNEWYAAKIAETDTDASELLAEMKSEFDIWFNDIQALLDDDVATALAAQVAELQGKFDTLAREGAVYDTIEDSDLDPILGSDGTPIQGKTVFGAGSSVDVTPESIGALPLTGGDMQGDINMNGQKLSGLNDPVEDDEAANAGYVKQQITDRVIYGKGKNLWTLGDIKSGVTSRAPLVLDPGTYTFSRGNVSGKLAFRLLVNSDLTNTDGSFVVSAGTAQSTTFTTTSKVYGININHESAAGSVDYNIQLEEGSVATEYEPYYKGLNKLTDRGMELLYENADPSSAFAQTRLDIDLSEFDFIDVEFCAVTTVGYRSIFRNRIGSTTNCISDNNGGKIASRLVISYSDHIIFEPGYLYNTYGAYTRNDTVLIPVRIYGIKGVFA